MWDLEDTIVGVATAARGAPRGVLRLSGPNVVECVASCFRCEGQLDGVRTAQVIPGELMLPPPLAPLPGMLYLWPDGRSYTRQPSAELHTLGSPPLLNAALRSVLDSGARLAGPGEFTLRAVLAGRIDLTQAEAVLAVIDAREQADLKVALAQLAGGLATPLHHLRQQLLELLAHLEAGLDFVEEDIEFIEPAELQQQLEQAACAVEELVSQLGSRGAADELPRVTLIGPANAGKSSLFNALLGREDALVSDRAGTTRDYLTAGWTAEQWQVALVDTAGLDARLTQPLDLAAQQLTADQHRQAHLRLLCLDATRRLNESELAALAGVDRNCLVVWTKCDLPLDEVSLAAGPPEAIRCSAVTGHGLNEIAAAVAQRMDEMTAPLLAAVPGTAARCHDALQRAASSLARARELAACRGDEALIAAEVRNSLDELGQIVGAVYTDDLLDQIFSRFCIGK